MRHYNLFISLDILQAVYFALRQEIIRSPTSERLSCIFRCQAPSPHCVSHRVVARAGNIFKGSDIKLTSYSFIIRGIVAYRDSSDVFFGGFQWRTSRKSISRHHTILSREPYPSSVKAGNPVVSLFFRIWVAASIICRRMTPSERSPLQAQPA